MSGFDSKLKENDYKIFDPEVLKEGDEIAREFYQSQDERAFRLKMEAFCKRIWKPWFDAGRWVWIDLTQPETVGLQVESKPWAPEVKKDVRAYLSSLGFPHDFDIIRSNEIWLGDFKFKLNTKHFIGIEKDDYDKAFNIGVPNFLFFIWANDRKMRYILWVKKHPSKYGKPKQVYNTEYYDVTRDCEKRAPPDAIIKGEVPHDLRTYWAWRLAMNEMASSGFYPKERKIIPTWQDFERVEEEFHRNVNFYESIKAPLWKVKRVIKPPETYKGLTNDMKSYRVSREEPRKGLHRKLELRRRAIDRIVDGYTRALMPRKPHKRMDKVSILGFDTEFDKGRLLSVQLALLDGRGNLKSKVIMENLEGYDAKRLLQDSINFMMECGVQPFNRIYLIAHYAVADIGHLANCLKDFKFREINRAMHSEFIVPENSDEKELASEQVSIGDFKLKVLDLFAYYQVGLEKIGPWIGLPKLKADRANINEMFTQKPDEFRAYAVRDAEIALKAFIELRDFLWDKYKVEILKSPSIASVAGNIFRINYLTEDNIPSPIAFLIDYKPYKTKKGWSTRRIKEARYAGDIRLRDIALMSYWGGRAECYVHGFIKGKFRLYDVSSLYPSCAMLQPLPNKNTQWFEIGLNNFEEPKLEGFACVEFEFPEDTRYPCLPVHGDLEDRLYFPLKGVSYCTMSEAREALRLGCKIKNIYGFGFKPSENEFNHVLALFMKDMLNLKNESPKGSLQYENYKLVMNALIGKLAQRNAEENLDYAQELFVAHGVPLEKWKRGKRMEKVGSLWAPEWASLILGKGRALMSQFINNGALITVTDSVLLPCNANLECDALKELRSVGSDLIVEPYKVESALIVRSKLYALFDAKGEIVKEAHHAVHLTEAQCKEIFKKALELGCAPDMEGNRDHIIRLREALQKGKPLGYSEMKPSKIYFRWDCKRMLDNPAINLFREHSDTKPIENVAELESEYFTLMKRQRAKFRGRPRQYSADLIEQVLKLKREGKSYREIARALKISLGKVQRILKTNFPTE